MSFFRFSLIVAGLIFAINANATPITVTGGSLQGSTGTIDVTLVSGNNYNVTWELDTTGFNDALAISSGHEYLTEVAFKIAGMSNVSLLSSGVGTLYFSSNVSNAGCSSGSPAGFACVALNSPGILATTDQVIGVSFNVDLDHTFDFINEAISFRGKYGPSDGWVISEEAIGGSTPVPEPSILVLLGLGLVGLGLSKRRLVG